MNKAVGCFILLICLMMMMLLCGCNETDNISFMGTVEISLDTATSTPLEYESITSESPSVNSPSKSLVDFEFLTQIFSMSYSEYTSRKEDFAGLTIKCYNFFPESVICYGFVIPEAGVECSMGMSYDDITRQLAQFSETRSVNFTIYNSGPHEYVFYENSSDLRTAIEYFLNYNTNIYRFCFVFDDKYELSYIEVDYPSFKKTSSIINQRYFMEYSDICFKHIDDLTTKDLSLLLTTKRSYIYSLYSLSSLELRSRIMDTFYYSGIDTSPIINTTIAYKSIIEGTEWMELLDEYPLFILIEKGRLLGADISSDFSTVRKQWGEPLHEGIYEDIGRDEIVYNYMTYVFEDIMVVCVGNESNKEDDKIISHCLVLPHDNEIFTFEGVYIGGS